MIGFSAIGTAYRRSLRLRAYKKVRADIESISDADLADMGLKRYQLGHVARVWALR